MGYYIKVFAKFLIYGMWRVSKSDFQIEKIQEKVIKYLTIKFLC